MAVHGLAVLILNFVSVKMIVGEEVDDSLAARQMAIDDVLSFKIVNLLKGLVLENSLSEEFYFVSCLKTIWR